MIFLYFSHPMWAVAGFEPAVLGSLVKFCTNCDMTAGKTKYVTFLPFTHPILTVVTFEPPNLGSLVNCPMAPCLRGRIHVWWTQLLDPVCSKVLWYDSGSEFYELIYWILVLIAKYSNILYDCWQTKYFYFVLIFTPNSSINWIGTCKLGMFGQFLYQLCCGALLESAYPSLVNSVTGSGL